MFLEFSLKFSPFNYNLFEVFTFKFGEPALLLPNLELSRGDAFAISTRDYLRAKTPVLFQTPAVWIAITPKKGVYSSSTDLIRVRLDQGVVHDHTIPNKWKAVQRGTKCLGSVQSSIQILLTNGSKKVDIG